MFAGLEVEINGEYQPIKPVENAIVVNIGDTLEALSGNQIKATKHRVMDIGVERFSSPFFFDPKFSARVPKDGLESSRKYCEDFEFDGKIENQESTNSL